MSALGASLLTIDLGAVNAAKTASLSDSAREVLGTDVEGGKLVPPGLLGDEIVVELVTMQDQVSEMIEGWRRS